MGEPTALRGSCSCGRYHYVVLVPENNDNELRVHFATDNEHRRSTSSLLTSYLRVPLPWYSSQTIALFPDESHLSISKTFVPPHAPHVQRKFCGYCGTHLSYWTEEPRGEESYLNVNLGSLSGRDLELLEDLGVLESEPDGDEMKDQQQKSSFDMGGELSAKESKPLQTENTGSAPFRSIRHGQTGGLTWFEEMIDGSRLGRTSKTRKGVGHSADGTTTISWEVSEFVDGVEELDAVDSAQTAPKSKRKIADIADDDLTMS